MKIKADDGSNYVEIDVEHVYSTDLAVLLNNGGKDEWVPKFVMEDWPDRGETGTALILENWAIKKGFV